MPGETLADVSAQTADTIHHELHVLVGHLRDLLDEKNLRDEQRFQAQTRAIDAAMAAAEKAVTKSEGANDKRFDAVNEFRRLVEDLTRTLATKGELVALSDRFTDLVARLEELTRALATKAEVLSLAERFTDLVARVDRTEGRSGGLNAGWGYLTGALGMAVGVIAIVVALVGR